MNFAKLEQRSNALSEQGYFWNINTGTPAFTLSTISLEIDYGYDFAIRLDNIPDNPDLNTEYFEV